MTQNTALTTAQTQAPAKANITTGGALSALVPQNLDDAYRLAKALAASGDMVPKHFQGKPEMTMAAIVRGMEIGLAPMQALSHIAVINGRPSIWGDAIPALLQRSGHHIDVEYEGSGDKLVAVATLTRGDTGKVIVRRFGMEDAKRANLTGKQGPWQQYPQRMCAHRARTWAARDGAADALMGMQVSEEVQDYGPDNARDVTPAERAAPRRGGVMYAEPDPVQETEHDEIIDAEIGDVDQSDSQGDTTPTSTALTEEEKAAILAEERAAAQAAE